jgi:hypothetical protein
VKVLLQNVGPTKRQLACALGLRPSKCLDTLSDHLIAITNAVTAAQWGRHDVISCRNTHCSDGLVGSHGTV